jgi:hypothetical protein
VTRRALIRQIGSAAFCDNGVMISREDIAAALDADRGAGFSDPTPNEVLLLVQGGDSDGQQPPAICVVHPALDALLTREMT